MRGRWQRAVDQLDTLAIDRPLSHRECRRLERALTQLTRPRRRWRRRAHRWSRRVVA